MATLLDYLSEITPTVHYTKVSKSFQLPALVCICHVSFSVPILLLLYADIA